MYDGYATLSPRRPSHDPEPLPAGALLALIERIEAAIEDETASLRSDMNFDISASNARKSRHLYDLTRAMKLQDPAGLGLTAQEALDRLREKLAANQAAIAAHLAAVTEVAALIRGAMERSENDGTYSESHFGRGF